MARRPNMGSREQLTSAQLVELRSQFGAMSLNELEIFYRATHNACRYSGIRVPSPRIMQELVQAWKELRKVRGT